MDILEGEKCERCSAISWERWYLSTYEELDLTETPEQLQSAACPICRVIGRGIAEYDKPISCLERSGKHFLVSLPRMRRRADFMLYDKDDEAFIKACNVHPKRVDFAHAKRWIQNCIATHGECKASRKSTLEDLMVLDCYERIVVSAPEHCEYVALSYVWGKAGLEETPDLPRIPDVLPRTVEDSIQATIMLGYRFLWIDRYVCLLMKIFRPMTNGAVRRSTRCSSPAASDQPNGYHLLFVPGDHYCSRRYRGE